MIQAIKVKPQQTDPDPQVSWYLWFWSLTDEQRNEIRRERGEPIEESDDESQPSK